MGSGQLRPTNAERSQRWHSSSRRRIGGETPLPTTNRATGNPADPSFFSGFFFHLKQVLCQLLPLLFSQVLGFAEK